MANGKIEYSKPELLDIGGVGEVTSGLPFCGLGSSYKPCQMGGTAEDRCVYGGTAGYGCSPGTSPAYHLPACDYGLSVSDAH